MKNLMSLRVTPMDITLNGPDARWNLPRPNQDIAASFFMSSDDPILHPEAYSIRRHEHALSPRDSTSA